ncbi:hypothetical protein BGX27_004978 [Mortierella sp. AM989]|nr:hypothetical protein BGX27_004978 [Mortierella sp. AM989]
MTLTLSKSSHPKQNLISRIFSRSSSSSKSHKSGSQTKKSSSSKSPFMSRFRRAPPTTMDKLQAKLDPSSDTTPASVAASKRKAKKAKAKKEASHKKKSTSLFGRH